MKSIVPPLNLNGIEPESDTSSRVNSGKPNYNITDRTDVSITETDFSDHGGDATDVEKTENRGAETERREKEKEKEKERENENGHVTGNRNSISAGSEKPLLNEMDKDRVPPETIRRCCGGPEGQGGCVIS